MALRGATPKANRHLALTVTTSNCANTRSHPFRNRLELVYDYLLEYNDDDLDDTNPDLIGIETAIAYGVAGALRMCDVEGSPLYAVELGSRHQFSKEGYCVPLNPDNKCKVIRGVTGIRFDSNTSDVQSLAYDAIEGVLGEPDFLGDFVTMTYDRVDFVQVRGNSISPLANRSDNGRSGSKVAIAAGSVSFALIAIFLGGFFRNIRQKKAGIKKQSDPGTGKRFLLGCAPRKYFELDDDQENRTGGFKVLNIAGGEPYYENPSITWSISDITSESGSILSNISRTTSKLERIEEVEEECPTDDEWDGTDNLDCSDHIDSITAEYLYDISSPRHHIGQWDAVEDTMEPAGCRYLDDSSRGSRSSSDAEGENEVLGLTRIENYLLECSDDSDSDDEDLESQLRDLTPGFDKYLVPVLSDDDEEDVVEYELADLYPVETISLSSSMDRGSMLNFSAETEETSNEKRIVLHQCAKEDKVSDTSASKWMVELLKELRKSQRRKLLTNGNEARVQADTE